MFNVKTQMWNWPFPDSEYAINSDARYELRLKAISEDTRYWYSWLGQVAGY